MTYKFGRFVELEVICLVFGWSKGCWISNSFIFGKDKSKFIHHLNHRFDCARIINNVMNVLNEVGSIPAKTPRAFLLNGWWIMMRDHHYSHKTSTAEQKHHILKKYSYIYKLLFQSTIWLKQFNTNPAFKCGLNRGRNNEETSPFIKAKWFHGSKELFEYFQRTLFLRNRPSGSGTFCGKLQTRIPDIFSRMSDVMWSENNAKTTRFLPVRLNLQT